MAEIYPNGTIQIYSGIKLDNTYQHCLSFSSTMAREIFFSRTPLLKHTVSNVSYQRVTSGVCELQIAIGQLYDCNYMRFQNAAFSTRWFYAFITNVEYVNNITSRIYFEIDVNTTYFFDWNYLPCMIEREHVTDDTVGAHTIPEPVGVKNAYPRLLNAVDVGSDGYAVVCAKVEMKDTTEFAGSEFVDNLASPIRFNIYNSGKDNKTIGTYEYRGFTTLTGLMRTTEWAKAAEEVVSFFYFPFNLLTTPIQGNYETVDRIVTHTTYNFAKPATLHGYTPRNNKLLTFPYNYITVDNGDTVNQYRQEWWRTQSLMFDYTGALCCNPEVYLMPCGYNNAASDTSPCWNEKSVIGSFPQVPYPVDSYMAWLAQTQSTRKAKVLTGAVSGGVSGATTGSVAGPVGGIIGGIVGATTGLVSAAGENAIAAAEMRDQSNKYSGQSTGSTELAVGEQKFRINQMCVTAEEAAAIDSFFDMYGYQVNVIRTPNIRSRAHWNYLKTNGCNMSSQAIPAEYVTKIKQIHDKGVTFWKSHDEIGNYGLDNRI